MKFFHNIDMAIQWYRYAIYIYDYSLAVSRSSILRNQYVARYSWSIAPWSREMGSKEGCTNTSRYFSYFIILIDAVLWHVTAWNNLFLQSYFQKNKGLKTLLISWLLNYLSTTISYVLCHLTFSWRFLVFNGLIFGTTDLKTFSNPHHFLIRV